MRAQAQRLTPGLEEPAPPRFQCLCLCKVPAEKAHPSPPEAPCSPALRNLALVPRKRLGILAAWLLSVKSWKPPRCSSGMMEG